ncbi:DotA/TraY family protein [Ruegeria sp.]|uniref:DotA/TraY family protein n=1 Tax=Ruegeria sp. TaxID=1879320 RepID=UPI00231ECA16|nr:DotA/TraY family protein [Ruegeria sp.]MDA7966217.1 DotA/TraY family protein [Ruegeria sp.]
MGLINGDETIVVANWLETVFTIFNAFCLLTMLIVLTYTVYAMIFDTAADGKTFGQSSDTKYTILRIVAGVIGFVPMVGGFSLAQVAFLWLVLQGSALADVTWRNVADDMLSGTPLTSGSFAQVPPESEKLVQQFGGAFDALVTGHICAINANRLERVINGDENVTRDEVSATGTTGVIRLRQSAVHLEDTSGFWDGVGGRQVVGMSYQMFFGEEAGGVAYSGRSNYCGSVAATDSYSAIENGSGLEVGLMAGRAQQQFAHLAEEVLPELSDAAQLVAFSIYDGERDSDALLAPSRAAVYTAVASYLSGPAIASTISDDVIEDVHEGLLNMVTTEGWMLAPVWQRGVASTVTAIEFPGDTLAMQINRNNLISDFLSGRGYARGSREESLTLDLLTKANADQDTWDEIASNVVNLSLPDVETPMNAARGEVPQSVIDQRAINRLYSGILNVFSPVATNTAEGNFGFIDPMLQVQRQGTILAGAGGTALTLGVGINVGNQSILGRGASFILGTGEAVGMASSGLTGVGVTLLIVGLVMMIVLPLVPMIYFFTAILSWLLQILELMFAWPLMLLRMFAPSREASLIGSDLSRALLTTLGIFLRPFFIVAGLVISMMVISVMLYVLHTFFGRLMFFDGISGADTVPDLAGFAATAVNGTIGIVVMVFVLIIYVLLAFLTVLYGSQIISEFGETAMNLIGAGLGRFTQPGAIADKTVMAGGLGYMGARSVGAQVGKAHNDLGKIAKQGQDGGARGLPRRPQ